jgi:hypothetical protein
MTLHIAAACELWRRAESRRGNSGSHLARGALLAALALLWSVGAPAAHSAQYADGLIGRQVVLKYAHVHLQIENRIIAPKAASYRVGQINGPWLWLEADGNRPSGWALADQVVSTEEASAFFTECIQSNPADDFAYSMRALIRHDFTHDLEGALSDYNETIRLTPTKPFGYCGRGLF